MAIWTPRLVDRTATGFFNGPGNKRVYWLAIHANYDRRGDRFWFEVDGSRFSWDRNGKPMFDRRSDCVAWARARNDYPLG